MMVIEDDGKTIMVIMMPRRQQFQMTNLFDHQLSLTVFVLLSSYPMALGRTYHRDTCPVHSYF